jgi:hypothetical protein
MRVGIALDPWKLEVFKRRLDDAGFTYEIKTGGDPLFTLLIVEVERAAILQPVVEAANNECARRKLD